MTDEGVVKCCICGLERKTKRTVKGDARTPKGWKNHAGQIYCADDWRKKYMLRAITMQIASPGEGADSWKQFRGDLKAMWVATTQVCNWMSTELYAQDVRRNGEDKMPPMTRAYLYPKARRPFPHCLRRRWPRSKIRSRRSTGPSVMTLSGSAPHRS